MKKALLFVVALFASLMIMPNAFALEVASVDGVKYSTVQEAIDNANGKTVTLLSNVTESVTIPSGMTVTLDLGSYTLTNIEGKHTITNEGNLTITGSGTVDNVSHARAAVYNSTTGIATLNSGIYTRSSEKGSSAGESGNNSYYTIENHGNMTINDSVQVLNNGSFSSLLHNGFYNGPAENPDGSLKPTLTINGGLFTGGLNTVKNDDDGILTINGGTFTNVAQAAVLNWNSTTITGGTFVSDKDVILNGKLDNIRDAGILNITDGNFSAGEGYNIITKMGGSNADYDANILVSGGTFNKTVEQMPIDENMEVVQNEDGTFTVQYKEADYSKVNELVAKANSIDKTKYTAESVKVLEDLINSIDYNKTVLEQDYVDGLAISLQNAIDGLVEKTEEPTNPEDPDTDLPDFPEVNLPDKDVKDEVSNPKTVDNISYAYIALLISGLGVFVSLKRLA